MNFKITTFDEPTINFRSENVYSPSDDTFLLIDYFKKTITDSSFDGYSLKKVRYLLDMGTGTGIIAIYLKLLANRLINFNPKIYASDILKEAINCAKKNEKLNVSKGKIHFIHSNLFQSFPAKLHNKFNIIIFNPPYLPALEDNGNNSFSDLDHSWSGGEMGYETLIEFFNEVLKFLNLAPNTVALLYYITSSRVEKENITEKLNYLGFQTEEVAKTHIFFEDIILNKATRISL